MNTARRVCYCLAVTGGVLLLATPTAAVPNIIEEPAWDSAVTGGQSLEVRGQGACSPGTPPEVFLNDEPLRTKRRSVGADGQWEATVTVPVLRIDDSQPAARELSLAVSCGEIRESIAVFYNDPLPNTGRDPANLSLFAVLLVGIGILLRIKHTSAPR